MSGAQYLRQLLAPLGVYDLEGPFQSGELEALGRPWTRRSPRWMSCTGSPVWPRPRTGAWSGPPPCSGAGPLPRRPRPCGRLWQPCSRIGGDSFTLDAINDTISGCGVNALVRGDRGGRDGGGFLSQGARDPARL